VDGQDAEAVYDVTNAAVERARSGGGPTLIEAKTYRFDEHSNRLPIPFAYRSEEEIAYHRRERDPVALYRDILVSRGLHSDVDAIEAAVAKTIEDAVQFAKDSPEPELQDMLDSMYSNPINFPVRHEGI